MIPVASASEIRQRALARGVSVYDELAAMKRSRDSAMNAVTREHRRLIEMERIAEERQREIERLEAEKVQAEFLRKKRLSASWREMIRLMLRQQEIMKDAADLLEWERSRFLARTGTSVSMIRREVCDKYGISRAELDSSGRVLQIVQPRFEVFWRSHNEARKSLADIGRRCGGWDHTSVLHGVRRYEHWQRMKAGTEPISKAFRKLQWGLIIPLAEAAE